MSSFRKNKKRADNALAELKLTLSRLKRAKEADPALRKAATESEAAVRAALREKNNEALQPALDQLERLLDKDLAPYRPNATWEFMKAIIFAVIIALCIRWMFVETFRIPSGSMIPTLLVGDQLVVNKSVFGPNFWVPLIDPDLSETGVEAIKKIGSPRLEFRIGERKIVLVSKKLWMRRLPRRGEVVVFHYPRDPFSRSDPRYNYIKRVIGLPGDKVEIREGQLYINDKMQMAEDIEPYIGPAGESSAYKFQLYHETLDSEPEPRTHDVIHVVPADRRDPYYFYGPVTVPDGMLLMMGDNRDRSSDSRFWGYVPISHLKGTALFIHLPLDPENHYLPRWERFFRPIR